MNSLFDSFFLIKPLLFMRTNDTFNQTYHLRADLQESLKQSQIDPSKLTPFQRVILTTDGTLTEILEAYLFEEIRLIKLFEGIVSIDQEILALDIPYGQEVLKRRILLQGKISKKNWLYAESIIVLERLEAEFRKKLLYSQIPIGKLWLEHRLETFKEIISSVREPAKEISNYFHIKEEDNLLCRTYCVFSSRQPIMMITEKFPENYFTQF